MWAHSFAFFSSYGKVVGIDVPGALPQMAAEDLRRGGRAGAHHRDPQERGRRGQIFPRLPLYRLARDGQDHLFQDRGQGGQLRAPGGRQPLQRMRRLPGDRRRLGARRGRDRRGQQQRRGQHPPAPGGGVFPPGLGQIPRLHPRRVPHALARRGQRPAQNPRGAARARHFYPRHHRNPQGAADHPLPLPAVRL